MTRKTNWPRRDQRVFDGRFRRYKRKRKTQASRTMIRPKGMDQYAYLVWLHPTWIKSQYSSEPPYDLVTIRALLKNSGGCYRLINTKLRRNSQRLKVYLGSDADLVWFSMLVPHVWKIYRLVDAK